MASTRRGGVGTYGASSCGVDPGAGSVCAWTASMASRIRAVMAADHAEYAYGVLSWLFFLRLAALFEQLRNDRRPSRLVAGAEPLSRVAVEVLVEEDQIPPVRIGLEALDAAVNRPPAAATQK